MCQECHHAWDMDNFNGWAARGHCIIEIYNWYWYHKMWVDQCKSASRLIYCDLLGVFNNTNLTKHLQHFVTPPTQCITHKMFIVYVIILTGRGVHVVDISLAARVLQTWRKHFHFPRFVVCAMFVTVSGAGVTFPSHPLSSVAKKFSAWPTLRCSGPCFAAADNVFHPD